MTLLEGSVGEKLWIGFLVNGQFHLAYQFMSKVPFGIYLQIPNENQQQKDLTRRVLVAVSLFMMVAPIWPLSELLKSAIADHHYDQLVVTMTFFAIFLGSYSLNLKLRES